MKIIRKILPALFILLFVLASSSCGKSDVRPSTTAAEKRVAATQQAEASETPQSSEEVNSFDCYKETIESYGQKRVDSMASLGYNIGMPEYDYAVRDVNGDSVDELVIFEVMEEMDSGNGMIGAIYTLDGDQPVELYFKGRHGSYTITADGYFVYHYHNLTLESSLAPSSWKWRRARA